MLYSKRSENTYRRGSEALMCCKRSPYIVVHYHSLPSSYVDEAQDNLLVDTLRESYPFRLA